MISDLNLRIIGANGPPQTARATRSRIALRRLGLSSVAAVAAFCLALLLDGAWSVAVAAGWIAAAGFFLLSVWLVVFGLDAEMTARAAQVEDPSRAVADSILLSAAVASLVSVGFVLLDAAGRSGSSKGAYIVLAVLTVGSAWTTVQTVFMLRYARLYYADPVGGIDFHADDRPDFRDLAYVALTIGMTFQVSDTDLTAKDIRHTAVRHALLSYLFGAVILAVTINIVAALASPR
jgi:uncharacterized membrane protein